MLPTKTPPTEYKDNWLDRLFIALFSQKMAKALGTKNRQPGYDGFVDLSQQIMQGRNAHHQQETVAVVLNSLVPAPVLWLIRLIPPAKWVCESNAWFATQLFEWLVGPTELRPAQIPQAAGPDRTYQSTVHIQKCRYLEQSQCVGMCINMCKLPTQKFFTEGFGIPLTMTPNFEDFSCDMVFGLPAPDITTEDCYQQPCLQECPTSTSISCPKVRS
jgi:hypothetical protein